MQIIEISLNLNFSSPSPKGYPALIANLNSLKNQKKKNSYLCGDLFALILLAFITGGIGKFITAVSSSVCCDCCAC